MELKADQENFKKNIKIASRDKRIEISIGSMKVRSVKSYAEIIKNNSYLGIESK